MFNTSAFHQQMAKAMEAAQRGDQHWRGSLKARYAAFKVAKAAAHDNKAATFMAVIETNAKLQPYLDQEVMNARLCRSQAETGPAEGDELETEAILRLAGFPHVDPVV